MCDPGDEHTEPRDWRTQDGGAFPPPGRSDILERLDIVWHGMGEMALEERREAAREIRLLRDEVRKLRAVLPRHIERILYEGEG